MKQAHIIFDIGTGNTRVGVWSVDGRALAIATRTSRYYKDTACSDGIYFLPNEWMDGLWDLLRKALEKAGDVEIVSITASSQRQGIVLISKDGESIMGRPNSDNGGAACLETIKWAPIKTKTYLERHTLYSCVKYRGVERLYPEAAKQTATYTSISDWVGYLFTGRAVWERSQAMHTAAYDVKKEDWSNELCVALGVDKQKLPPVAIAGTVLGKVKPEICKAFGLQQNAVFIVGGADTQIGLVGSGAEPGEIAVLSGTTTPVMIEKDRFDQKSAGWISTHAVPGKFMWEINAGCTGINLMRFKDMFFQSVPYDTLNRRCLEIGRLPQCMAMFAWGPHTDAEPVQNGGFLSTVQLPHDMIAEEYYYAMNLDIAFGIYRCVKRMCEIDGYNKPYIIGGGGGLQSPIMAQTLADMTQKEILLYEGFEQATMKGCLKLCNDALQIRLPARKPTTRIKPKKNTDLLAYFERWRQYRECLKSMNQ